MKLYTMDLGWQGGFAVVANDSHEANRIIEERLKTKPEGLPENAQWSYLSALKWWREETENRLWEEFELTHGTVAEFAGE